MVTARPTAVNMNEAAVRFKNVLKDLPTDLAERKEKLILQLEDMLRSAFKMILRGWSPRAPSVQFESSSKRR